jgi:hypothetical protein
MFTQSFKKGKNKMIFKTKTDTIAWMIESFIISLIVIFAILHQSKIAFERGKEIGKKEGYTEACKSFDAQNKIENKK